MMRFAILLAAAHALVATTHLQQRASKRFMSTCAEPAINYDAWLEEAGIGGKFAIDGDGVRATADIDGLEVVATVPDALALAVDADADWAGSLCRAAIEARGAGGPRAAYVRSWTGGGWATDSGDLDARDRELDCLLATGSDNDFEIYKKFGLKCHPAVDRAAYRLAALAGCRTETAARAALSARGFEFRRCREALIPLVTEPTRTEGTARRRRELEVAEVFSKALARAALVDAEGAPTVAVVPVHDALRHAPTANTKLVRDPRYDDAFCLVATRAVGAGEALTRDFGTAPSLGQLTGGGGDAEDEALRLLLHFGIRP